MQLHLKKSLFHIQLLQMQKLLIIQKKMMTGEVKVENNVVTFADGNKITLPENVLQLLKGHEGSMTLGIRGEDIKTEDRYLEQYRENIQHAVITDTEVMGNEDNLYFQFGGTQAVARVSKYEVAQVGDTIDFVFMPEKLHFFDK